MQFQKKQISEMLYTPMTTWLLIMSMVQNQLSIKVHLKLIYVDKNPAFQEQQVQNK